MTVQTHPNGIAPTEAGTYRLGAKGGRMAEAWQFIWDRFDGADWKDGMLLAREAAEAFNLKPLTVSEMLCRMRAAGVLEQKMIEAPTEYTRKRGRLKGESEEQYATVQASTFTSKRKRVHYRISEDGRSMVTRAGGGRGHG